MITAHSDTETPKKDLISPFFIAALFIAGMTIIGISFAFAYNAIRGDDKPETVSESRQQVREATENSEVTMAQAAFRMAWNDQSLSSKAEICDMYEESPELVSTLFIVGLEDIDSDAAGLLDHEFISGFFAVECP